MAVVHVDPRVVTAVKAWAAAGVEGAAMLAEQRRALDPLLLPTLIGEVAEITAEQLLVVLDRPTAPPRRDERPVPFLGVELSQEQGRRAAAWLDEQRDNAKALSLAPEAWSEQLADGMRRVLERMRGRSLSSTASALGSTVADGALRGATRGFDGGADPTSSTKAGLRGALSARAFGNKKQ
ncbi:MAG: hypothetical protein HYS27_03985 [Deltaproteobacteria bacterium]|nr:hypothetical protein [Deltaproteobacteria bacterium]